jgi:hypothetical protein
MATMAVARHLVTTSFNVIDNVGVHSCSAERVNDFDTSGFGI